jgi:hypothetical protein
MSLTTSIVGFCAVTFLGYWFSFCLLGYYADHCRPYPQDVLDERTKDQNRAHNARLQNRAALVAGLVLAVIWLAIMHGNLVK